MILSVPKKRQPYGQNDKDMLSEIVFGVDKASNRRVGMTNLSGPQTKGRMSFWPIYPFKHCLIL